MAADRSSIRRLEDLPNVGPATADDLRRLGIIRPAQLRRRNPIRLYQSLCRITKTRQDPCVADVFIAIVRYMNGDPPAPWWSYTAERKRLHPWIGASAGAGAKARTGGRVDDGHRARAARPARRRRAGGLPP